MAINRVVKNKNYTTISNIALKDDRLSWKAKGIIAYMLSMPDDWSFYTSELVKHATDGEKSFRSGFKELTDLGYAKKHPVYENGKIKYWETVINEQAQEIDLLSGFVQVENVQVENVQVENDALLSTNRTNNLKEQNTDSNNIYTLFQYWNEIGITKHRKMNQTMKSHLNARIDEYSIDELKKAIDNYAAILNSNKYYWTHKWGLQDFMKPNNVTRFVNENTPFKNFAVDAPKKSAKRVNRSESQYDDYDYGF